MVLALAPAKLKSIQLDKEAKTADVVVAADQVSLAIGRNGQNIRLASKLTGFEINLIKEGGEDEYDIELIDFKEELGEELYMKLINAGMDTAKEVIDADDETLLAVEGLTQEKIDEIREMMQRDLDEAEVEEDEEEEEEEEEEEVEEEKEAAPVENALPAQERSEPTATEPSVTEEPAQVEKPEQDEQSEQAEKTEKTE